MKKLFKFIPLLVLPLTLSSCTIFNRENNNSSSTQTSDTSSTTSSSTSSVIPPVNGISISGDSSVAIDQTITLTVNFDASAFTNTKVTWKSSSSSIAYVYTTGKVKGKGVGKATITATMTNNNGDKVSATKEITVVAPHASGLTLSSTSMNIGFGKTATISASVTPAAAENKTVNWTTSNSSVVSLSKTTTTANGELVTLTAGNSEGNATITATSVDGNFSKTCSVSVRSVTGTTIMIYMCGADLESASGLATSDLDEILSVSGQPSDVNIVVQTGGASSWSKSGISASKSQRWEIRNRSLNKVSAYETNKKNMGLQSTLEDFVTWGLSNYQADKYGLIMWNHGGAMGGCCYDEQFNDDSISAEECYNAVKNARAAAGISSKLEWIAYDACLMAVQDVAEYNSHNFNYMVCSQESEAGEGYDYDAWLPTLYNNSSISGATLLPKVAQTFIADQRQAYISYYGSSQYKYYFDQTQSVLDLNKMDAYKTAFESFASSLNSIIGTNSTKTKALGNAIYSAQKYGQSNGSYPFDVYDAKQAIQNIVANSNFSSLSSQASTLYSKLNDLVIYEEHGEATSGDGVCMFCPIINSWYYGSSTKSNFTNWITVANKVYNVM